MRHDVLPAVALPRRVQPFAGHQRQVQSGSDTRCGGDDGGDRVDDSHRGRQHSGVIVVTVGAGQTDESYKIKLLINK